MPTTPPEIEKIIKALTTKYDVRFFDGTTYEAPELFAKELLEALTTLHQKHQEEVKKAVEEIYNHFSWCRECSEGPSCSEALAIKEKYSPIKSDKQ